jgi:twitching motility two-component system response regulator PilH
MSRILIVDDSPTELHVLKGMMEKNGHQAITAATGEEGITKAKQEKPDLILMDVVLPGISGFQATRQITKDPDTSHLPVIIVTTKDQETDRVWGLRQGAKDYVVKPVVEADIIGKIKAVLQM